VAAARKSGLKARLSQNLMTFLASVQRFVVGHFGKKAVNLGQLKLVVGCGLWRSRVIPRTVLIDSDRLRELNAAISTANTSKSGQPLPGGL
jgi:hypothetical protein